MIERLITFAEALRRVMWTTLIFLAAGPFLGAIGIVSLSYLTAVPHVSTSKAPALLSFLLTIGFSVPVAYFVGALPAAATGFVVAAMSRHGSPAPALYLVAAVVGALLSGVIVYGVFGSESWAKDPSALRALALTGALAAIPCTWLTRGLRLAPVPDENMAGDIAHQRGRRYS